MILILETYWKAVVAAKGGTNSILMHKVLERDVQQEYMGLMTRCSYTFSHIV